MGHSASKMYPDTAELFKAADIAQPLRVTIERVDVGTVKDDGEALHVSFVGQSKKLRLNKTNALSLADRFGDDTDGWTGKEVMLAAVAVEYQGNMTKGIRII